MLHRLPDPSDKGAPGIATGGAVVTSEPGHIVPLEKLPFVRITQVDADNLSLGRNPGAAGHGWKCRPGCNVLHSPFHEDASA